jgi:hypothetical protein
MINTKSVIQVQVNIEGIHSVQVLKDRLQSAIGNVSIIRYAITQKHAIIYIEATPTEGLATFELAVDGKEFSLINVVEDIVKENPAYTEGSVQEAFAEQKSDEPLAAMAIIFDRDPQIDYLLTKEFQLNQLSTYDGLVSISTENGLVLIEKQCNVVIDYSTYNKDTGTVRLLQTSRSEEEDLETTEDEELTPEQIEEIRNILKEGTEFIERVKESAQVRLAVQKEHDIAKMREALDMVSELSENEIQGDSTTLEEQLRRDLESAENLLFSEASRQMISLLSDLDAIDNNKPYKLPERTLALMTEREKNVVEMQDIIDVVKDVLNVDRADTLLGGAKIRFNGIPDKVLYDEPVSDIEETTITEEELAQFSIGDTIVETIELKVALISFGSFDEYAASHNIVGWDLFTPTTVLIKYMDGSNTPIEKIQKFHDMMNSLDTGWIDKPEVPAITSKFVSELNQVLDRDVVQEFLNRVQKHNIFVRDSTAKIRKALLDMELDYNALKDEVNLMIDWDNLTAFASKKERTEYRTKGVEVGYALEDGKRSVNGKYENLVKVSTGLDDGDFYIPVSILTDELRAKYVFCNYAYYIDDLPEYAFYEVHVNGHVILIEKTDL